MRCVNPIKVSIDLSDFDNAIEKMNRLLSLLGEMKEIVSSLTIDVSYCSKDSSMESEVAECDM